MNLKAQMAALKAAMQKTVDAAKAEDRDLTPEESTDIEAKAAEFKQLGEQLEKAQKAHALVSGLADAPADVPEGESGPEAPAKAGNIGRAFVESDGFKAFRKAHPTGTDSGTPIRIEAKGLGGVNELGIGRKATIDSATGQIRTEREPGYRNYLPVDEPLTFLDLITTGTTNVAYSEYAQIVAETNNAAVVAEGQLKPLSDVTTDKQESKAFTYADGFDITNQTLADDGALAAFMESRVRRHVLGVVEQKLFNGTGAGTEPLGIMNTTGTLAQAFDTDVVVTLARALEKYQASNSDSDAQAIVMNPVDIWNLRLLKGSDGHYLLGNPLQQGPIPTPWGIPLVRSNKITAGTALVGRFDSVNFLQLEPLNVLAFNQHKDYAQRNMVYVRAEMRGRQLFYAPREVVVADLTAA
jgi:HK97 family phage major capsid protein